jgi:S-adenosylmethionine-diacylglycerol 3-amino-3-carboxypropyl transferase
MRISTLAHQLREQVFHQVHHGNLVYNTCWEDPRCDRALLQLNEDSKVVMITSAGCNALDYLLDNPKEIHCVDINPRQNALLELKKGFFKAANHQQLFDFFGTGATPHYYDVYYNKGVRDALEAGPVRRYWDKNINIFSGTGLRPSFYWHGSSGAMAWLIRQWFKTQPEASKVTRRMFESQTMEEQCNLYSLLEPRFLNRFLRWAMKQHLVQSMLGVPKSQQLLASELFTDGMAGYIRSCLRQVFMGLPLHDNYFWRLYFYGRYTPVCCPNYLKPEYFNTLQQRAERIQTHTCYLNTFYKENPGQYTHFVLLDHQDWLATHLKPALIEEWQLIFANAAPNAKVLFRSASFNPDFLPDFVQERMNWDLDAAKAAQSVDRVGTYASTWIGTIKS